MPLEPTVGKHIIDTVNKIRDSDITFVYSFLQVYINVHNLYDDIINDSPMIHTTTCRLTTSFKFQFLIFFSKPLKRQMTFTII